MQKIRVIALLAIIFMFSIISAEANSLILKYDNAWSFHEEMAVVALQGKYGFIDRNGKEVIPLIYDEIKVPLFYDTFGYFYMGPVLAKRDGKYGFIDKTGKAVQPHNFGV